MMLHAIYHRATHRPEHAVFLFRGDVGRVQVWRALMGLQLEVTGQAHTPSAYQMGPELVHLAEFPDERAAPRMIWRRGGGVGCARTVRPVDGAA